MRKHRGLIALLIIFSMAPALSGCSTVYSNYRELQQLLVIQTLGLDYTATGSVQVSMAAAAQASGTAPRQICAGGATISAAIDRAYSNSYEQEIFFAQANHLLIGEQAAENGVEAFLDYICQSPTLRIDIPLYIVREGSAYQAVTEVGDQERGVSEVMESVRETFATASNSHVFTVADTLRSLERYGSALVCAVSCVPSSETTSEDEEPPLTLSPAGYGIIREGKLCKYIEYDQSLAVGLLTGSVPISPVVVKDSYGKVCTLEVNSGSAQVEPVWSDSGELTGLNIRVQVDADLLESGSPVSMQGADYIDRLTAGLESAVSAQVSELMQSSRSLKADFLGLAARVQRSSPESYAKLSQSFEDLLPNLELELTVSGKISHTNDVKEGNA